MMFIENITILQISIAAFIGYLTSWVIYCRYFHPLCQIPGPLLASISRAWIIYKTARGDMEYTQRRLHKKHGYLVRIAPNEVACSDPEAIRTLYGTKTNFTKTDYYDAWAPPNNGYVGHFPARDENVHTEHRRIVNNVYSMSSVLESENSIDVCTQLFCKTMSDFAKRKTVIDLSVWINMYAFDVLGELFYGKMFGFLHQRKDVGGYIEAIDSLLPAFTIGGTVPSYLTKIYFLCTVLLSHRVRGALGAVKHIENASTAAVEQRSQEVSKSKDEKHDMLRKMLEITHERGDRLNFTYDDICVESHSSIFAGGDTTAIAITSILYHLLKHPAAYSKLTTEIDTAVDNGTLSVPVAYSEAIKLPYLKACVNEGMRLHPSVGLTMPRLSPSGGATISGFHFPAGYRIGINSAVLHYDKDVFGADSEAFNPDRWSEGDNVRMERTMLQFGAGPRTCLGKNISLSEMYKLVPQMVYLFDMRLAEKEKQWKTRNYWFNKQSDVYVIFEERKH